MLLYITCCRHLFFTNKLFDWLIIKKNVLIVELLFYFDRYTFITLSKTSKLFIFCSKSSHNPIELRLRHIVRIRREPSIVGDETKGPHARRHLRQQREGVHLQVLPGIQWKWKAAGGCQFIIYTMKIQQIPSSNTELLEYVQSTASYPISLKTRLYYRGIKIHASNLTLTCAWT